MDRAEHSRTRTSCLLNVVEAGTGEVVVLLHGLGSTHRDWAAQIDALSRTHRVIALDLRGHGQSPPAALGVTMDELAEDVAAALVARHAGPSRVIGWSLGGLVATVLAVRHPELVRSLVVVNSPPSCRPSSFRERFLWTQRRVLTRYLSPRALGPFISRRLFPDADQATLRREFVERFAANDEQSYRAVFGAIERYDCGGIPERVRCPVLIVAGDRDYWPVAAKRLQAARFPNSRVAVVEESGHATPVERPEEFNAIVSSFFSGRPQATVTRPRRVSNLAAIGLVLAMFGCAGGESVDGEPADPGASTRGAPPAGEPTAAPDPSAPAPGGADPGAPVPTGSTPGTTLPPAPVPDATSPTQTPPASTAPGSTPPPTGNPTPAPTSTTPMPVPTTPTAAGSRCRVSTTSVYCEHRVTSFKASPTEVRDVYWQTPATPAPAEGYPVVLIYQGSLFAPSLTWAELAPSVPFGGFYQGVLQASLLDHGFTVIAPTAAGGLAWQTNAGAPYETTTDHVFIGALIDAIEKGEFGPADPTHFYATGISSGGYMTSRMAVSYPGVFRALAIESGSYATCLGPLCNVPATLPADHPATLFLHGAADATVPLATAQPYYDKLSAQGVDTEIVVDQTAGHQWLSVAPERVTDWFLSH